MAQDINEVKDVEVVKVKPAQDGETVDEETGEKDTQSSSSEDEQTDEESSDEGSESDEESSDKSSDDETKKPDGLHGRTVKQGTNDGEGDDLAEVEGETPRERALRKEVTRLKRLSRGEKAKDLFGPETAKADAPEKKQTTEDLSDADREVLKQYDPKQLAELESIFGIIAKRQGYVKKGEFQAATNQQIATATLDDFLSKHPEYLPENDTDNILWSQFKEGVQLYRTPENPRDYAKIFERVHREVFGIKQGGDIKKTLAKAEKIKVASHANASSQKKVVKSSTTVNLDPSLGEHLKGFSDEEKKDIFGG